MGTERTPKKERSRTKLKTNKQRTPLSCFEERDGGSDQRFKEERNDDPTHQVFCSPSRIRWAKFRDWTASGEGEVTEEPLTEEEDKFAEEEGVEEEVAKVGFSEVGFFTCLSVVCVRFQRPHLSHQYQVLSCFVRLELPFVGLTLVQLLFEDEVGAVGPT